MLRDKLSALEPEKWSLELLRALKEFEYKAKWVRYNPEEKPPRELPQPFIAKMDGNYIIIMKSNDKEFLTYSLEKNAPPSLPLKISGSNGTVWLS